MPKIKTPAVTGVLIALLAGVKTNFGRPARRKFGHLACWLVITAQFGGDAWSFQFEAQGLESGSFRNLDPLVLIAI